MLSNHSQDLGRELFERRNAPAARLRRDAVIIAPALQPLDRRGYAHLKTFGRLAPRCARSHGFDNAYPQVTRIGLHCPPPTVRRINAQKTPSPLTVWESPDSNLAKTALVQESRHFCYLLRCSIFQFGVCLQLSTSELRIIRKLRGRFHNI